MVSSYDFGAHGDILIEAQSESTNWWYNLTKYQRRDTTWVSYSTIPIDEDNPPYTKCGMADYWKGLMLADTLCPDTITIISQIEATQDLDDYIHGVLASDLGDYLNTFEEYRGFYCRGKHTRTSPWKKDFFVYSDIDSFNVGLGYADSIGPGLAHFIDSTEMYNYFVPSLFRFSRTDEFRKSVNWLSERIDSHTNNPCVIALGDWSWSPGDTNKAIGAQSHVKNLGYSIPKTTACGVVYMKRIQYWTPPHRDSDTLDFPADTLCWKHNTGHEIGHCVNFGESDDSTSIMTDTLRNFSNPPTQYHQADLDSFLVKPRIF
ncbi:MAG: hypothetical protein NTW14_01465 [bacterium]|nr:hypothetical protein [bacterium]